MKTLLDDRTKVLLELFKELMVNMLSKDFDEWLAEFRKFVCKKPCWNEGMIYAPLEWSEDYGEVAENRVQDRIFFLNDEGGIDWRLPTEKEVSRALKAMKPDGFVVGKYYWTSTPFSNGSGSTIVRTCDGRGGGLEYESHLLLKSCDQQYPHFRLCRSVAIPQ